MCNGSGMDDAYEGVICGCCFGRQYCPECDGSWEQE